MKLCPILRGPLCGLRMSGTAICKSMITDHFFADQSVVAEVKAAVARSATREIPAILDRAMG